MEFDIELYDLDIDINTWVEWQDDPDYSPNDGLYDKFIWVVYLQVGNTRIDITDELSAKECKQIEKQIGKYCKSLIILFEPGTLFILPVLSKFLKVPDGAIGIISLIGNFGAHLTVAFAISSLMMYLCKWHS